jgi:hypothetical protein
MNVFLTTAVIGAVIAFVGLAAAVTSNRDAAARRAENEAKTHIVSKIG